MKTKILLASALLLLTLFWACHLGPTDSQDTFDVVGDTSWTSCDSVFVELLSNDGKPLDTLFNDSLKSLDQLKHLTAAKYPGGTAKIHIVGRKNGGPCFEETRSFDGTGSHVTVDTVLSAATKVASVDIQPHTLTLAADDTPATLIATIKPAYAEQAFIWSVGDSQIAVLDFPNGPGGGKVKVKPLKTGTVTIRVSSKKDTSKHDELSLTIGSANGATVSLKPDSLVLFYGGPEDTLHAKVLPEGSDQGLDWTSDDPKVAEVDSGGRVKPVGEGKTRIHAKSRAFGVSAATAVQVKRDVPVLTVTSRSGAAVNVPIVFTTKATQEFGTLVLFLCDLDGDGHWDDSLVGPWAGTAVDLPEVKYAYPKEGNYTAKFLVRDSEGNDATAEVSVNIGNQPPEILTISPDTTISIKDSIPLLAKVKDFEGKVAWCGWDYEGDGIYDDSISKPDSVVDIVFGHRYMKAGNFNAVLGVRDDAGKSRTDTVRVKVLLDLPVADAGNDTTVMAGTFVQVHAKGTDKFGTIAYREIKIGSGPYIALSKQDTAIRPPVDSGKFPIVVRVTDDDGGTAEDTMIVTVSSPSKSNADLADLAPSTGSLTPGFKPITAFYSLVVAYADSQISVKGTTSDTAAKLAVNGKPASSGSSSDPVTVQVGTSVNVFQLVVTAQDGTQKVYTVSVTRAPSAEAQLSKLETTGFTLKPAFASATLDYADTVANAQASVILKPTVSNVGAKVSVNDSTLPSGTPTFPQALKVGDNPIKVMVTAQDGKTKATYTVNVVRRAKAILSRKLGALAVSQVDSIEAPLGGAVKIFSPDSAGYHFTKWSITEGTASIADSMSDSTQLTLGSATVRAQAAFAINVYTITTQAGAGGVLTLASAILNHGSDDTATISPLVGYRVLTFLDNGNAAATLGSKLGAQTYLLKNVTGNHKLEATFIRVYNLTASATGNGSVTAPPAVVDSGSNYAFAFTTTVTGYFLSALTDNGAAETPGGDPTASSSYALTGINADHAIAATFSIRTFTMKVTGHDLCVLPVVTCTDPKLCILRFCIAGSGPDSDSLTVNYGVSYNITTKDTLGTRSFVNWTKDGAAFATTAATTTSPVTANVNYSGNYTPIIRCCPTCCIILNPPVSQPILNSTIIAPPPLQQSMLPIQEN